jgi:hypothetical protein
MAAISALSCGVMVWPDDDLLLCYLNSGGMCRERRSHSVSRREALVSTFVLGFAMLYSVKEWKHHLSVHNYVLFCQVLKESIDSGLRVLIPTNYQDFYRILNVQIHVEIEQLVACSIPYESNNQFVLKSPQIL